ncbi:MAG: carbamoyltransferase HypF [Bryobacterales bacterium]|nr:carbamoyltransferase HypF [Bryobacterales bacterium]
MTPEPSRELVRLRLEVRGMVQGIGFRPAVWQLAHAHGLAGFVGNHSEGAVMEVEGPSHKVAAFRASFDAQPPPLARVDAIVAISLPPRGDREFCIVASTVKEQASTPISPDLGTCEACLREMGDPANRRFGYPFTNCTQCGPRFTITEDIPYDRPRTTMRHFTMCAACSAEYHDPSDRRFHAQPNACWDCGPNVWLAVTGRSLMEPPRGREALQAARRTLNEGGILAVKGIGGFHLACDATNADAVERLRQRKGRAEKPFAVMVAGVEVALQFAHASDAEQALLACRERPIVLLRKRLNASLPLAPQVAPESPHWGVMLAYSPLHHLLLDGNGDDPCVFVMTSGNWSEEPIARDNEEALDRLSPLADAFLLHDRGIHVVADDSVVRMVEGRELPLRRSRGYAPLPVRLPRVSASVLAVGGELKSTFCITKTDYAYLSQHIGDVGNLETQHAFERALGHFLSLFRAEPQVVVRDLHPGYLSSAWAKRYAASRGLPSLGVQHHHAHVAALLAEHGLNDDEPFLGVAFDGTGYGEDGAIWGGEFLRVHQGSVSRVAHLRYSPLPGGDASIRHPWRCAVAHLREAGVSPREIEVLLPGHDDELPVVLRQLERNLNCIPSSSMGRLFDAVAAVLGLRHTVTFEAQAAMQLEALCEGLPFTDPYPFCLCHSMPDAEVACPQTFDPAPLWLELIRDLRAGIHRALIAARFHSTVAAMVLQLCEVQRVQNQVCRVGLTGGVFQNVRLLEESIALLQSAGFSVHHHQLVPPNDGGIALGQAWLALRQLQQ